MKVIVTLLLLLSLSCISSACSGTSAAPAPTPVADRSEPSPVPPSPVPPTPVSPTPVPALGPQLPATVSDYEGNPVTITAVDRIVALNGDITEIVVALGLGANLVGVDLSATYPPELVATLPRIGYQYNLNAEGILGLNPSIVIGKEGAGPPEVISQLRAAGIPVMLVSDPQDIGAPATKIRDVAAALGVREAGEQLVATLEADLAAAQARLAETTAPAPKVLFLYLRGTTTQAVAGRDTAADTMITAAGGINIAAELGLEGFELLSPELVARAQPDVILLMESGLQSMGGAAGLLAIPGLADTPAGQAGRVVAMDGLYLVGLGPRTGQAILDLLPQLHPELMEPRS